MCIYLPSTRRENRPFPGGGGGGGGGGGVCVWGGLVTLYSPGRHPALKSFFLPKPVENCSFIRLLFFF